MNRRGWIRLVEAMFAIMIILSIILTVSVNRQQTVGNDLTGIIKPILNEISQNANLREKVLMNSKEDVKSFVAEKMKAYPYLDFDIEICGISEICGLAKVSDNVQGDIFTSERVISATPNQPYETYGPKKVKMFLWIKRQ